MARRFSPLGAALAGTAAFVMSASPAMARGWGGWRHHRHHDRVDAGDVIAGLLIVGTVAAVASAATKAKRERDYRGDDYPVRDDRDYRGSNRRYDDDRPDYGARGSREDGAGDYRGAGGIGQALDTCAGEVERPDRRIDRVDTVERDSEGWRIEGQTDNGRGFVCSISDSGRVRSVTVGGQAA